MGRVANLTGSSGRRGVMIVSENILIATRPALEAVTSAVDVPSQQILVVEDETRIGQIVSAYLQRDGYRVRQARDGREALQMVQAELPDLIVLDLMLPEVSGW